MGQRNGNSFYLAGSSHMAEFKEYLSLQRDFYPNKGHADASCHIMMYHFLRRSKVPFQKNYHQFSCHQKKLLLELHRDGWMRMHIVVYLMPSTFPTIRMILDEFRFTASGVSWKMGPIYIAKICKYLRKLVIFRSLSDCWKNRAFVASCGGLSFDIRKLNQVQPQLHCHLQQSDSAWLLNFIVPKDSRFVSIRLHDMILVWCDMVSQEEGSIQLVPSLFKCSCSSLI